MKEMSTWQVSTPPASGPAHTIVSPMALPRISGRLQVACERMGTGACLSQSSQHVPCVLPHLCSYRGLDAEESVQSCVLSAVAVPGDLGWLVAENVHLWEAHRRHVLIDINLRLQLEQRHVVAEFYALVKLRVHDDARELP